MTRRLLISIALLLAAAPAAAGADAVELDRALAREPATVTLTNGRTVRGILDGMHEGRLHLRLATDGGEVGYSFAPAEMAQLAVPGRELENDIAELLDRGDVETAMPLLEALCRHRVRYLPVLTPEQQRPLWMLVNRGGPRADPPIMLAVVRALEPRADTPELRQALLEAELGIAERLGDRDRMGALARRWCATADPAGPSALGWRVLAAAAYSSGEYDEARWIALQPVTFAGHLPMRDLDLCYALAIAAADRAGDVGHARRLRAEMAQHGLAWPPAGEFAALGEHYLPRVGDIGPERPFHAAGPAVPQIAQPAAAGPASARRLLFEPESTP